MIRRRPCDRQPCGGSARVGEQGGELLGDGAELLGVGADAVDVVLVFAAALPGGGLALDGDQVVAGEADLFAGDAGMGPGAVMLGTADDAELVGPAADRAIVVQGSRIGCRGEAEALGHTDRVRCARLRLPMLMPISLVDNAIEILLVSSGLVPKSREVK